MRGLKQLTKAQAEYTEVASFTDAWIETLCRKIITIPPSRIFYRCVDWNKKKYGDKKTNLGRIFYRCVDWNVNGNSWIKYEYWVASFTDAWIETFTVNNRCAHPKRRIFYRCVDWNTALITLSAENPSRIFYRCVDWNTICQPFRQQRIVASFTDAWIETGK